MRLWIEKSRKGQSNQCQVMVKCQRRIEVVIEFSNKKVDHNFVENSCSETECKHFTISRLSKDEVVEKVTDNYFS